MSLPNHIVWRSERNQPVVARVAVAGDFLPAGKLALPANANWRNMAKPIERYFDDVALTFANLECAINSEGLAPRVLCGIGQIVEAHEAALDYLDSIQARIIGLANNHAYDFGAAGIERTRAAIDRRKTNAIGAGHHLDSPPEICLWEGPESIRVGFWSAAKATLDPATRSREGVEPATVERARAACNAMSARHANVRIALLHVGCLRTNRPDPEDVRLMDSIAQCGFDIVAASHSHRISGYREIPGPRGRTSFCFYGLGSLVSGYVADPIEREGLVVVAGLTAAGDLARVELRPILLQENGFGSVPNERASETILNRFRNLSSEIEDASFIRRFYEDVSPGLTRLYLRDVRTAYRQAGARGLARKASRLRVRHLRRLVHKIVR